MVLKSGLVSMQRDALLRAERWKTLWTVKGSVEESAREVGTVQVRHGASRRLLTSQHRREHFVIMLFSSFHLLLLSSCLSPSHSKAAEGEMGWVCSCRWPALSPIEQIRVAQVFCVAFWWRRHQGLELNQRFFFNKFSSNCKQTLLQLEKNAPWKAWIIPCAQKGVSRWRGYRYFSVHIVFFASLFLISLWNSRCH